MARAGGARVQRPVWALAARLERLALTPTALSCRIRAHESRMSVGSAARVAEATCEPGFLRYSWLAGRMAANIVAVAARSGDGPPPIRHTFPQESALQEMRREPWTGATFHGPTGEQLYGSNP